MIIRELSGTQTRMDRGSYKSISGLEDHVQPLH